MIENYGFRCIRCCAFPVIHLHADIGPALAQAGMFRPLRHGRVQLCLCQIQPAFTPSQTCGEFRELRRWRSKQAHGRQQWPGSRRASSIDQRGEARFSISASTVVCNFSMWAPFEPIVRGVESDDEALGLYGKRVHVEA